MKSKIGKKKDKGERSTLKEKEGKIVSLSNREKLISDLKNDSNFIISLASKFGVDKSDIKIEDIKFKIGGTASLGKTRYNILIELKNEETGNFDDKWKNHRLIDLKESQDPEKSIKNAKKMLNNSDESRYITNIELDNGKFYIREDSPKNKGEFIQEDILYKDGQINLADLSGLDKTNYLEMIANSVAYSHLQTGNKDEIINDAGDEISVEMVKASEILFKSFNEMHQEFQDAYENNEFKI